MMKREPSCSMEQVPRLFEVHGSDDAFESESIPAEYPDHVWSLDLTAVPTFGGFWTLLIPNSLAQVRHKQYSAVLPIALPFALKRHF